MSTRRTTLEGRPTVLIEAPRPSSEARKRLRPPSTAFVVGVLWAAFVILATLLGACGDPAAPAVPVTITPGTKNLKSLGETIQLTAVAKDAQGNVRPHERDELRASRSWTSPRASTASGSRPRI